MKKWFNSDEIVSNMMKIRSVLRKQEKWEHQKIQCGNFLGPLFSSLLVHFAAYLFWPIHVNLHGGDGPNMFFLQTVSITVPKYPPAQYQHPLINSDTEKKRRHPSLTACPWKMVVARRSFPIGLSVTFQRVILFVASMFAQLPDPILK